MFRNLYITLTLIVGVTSIIGMATTNSHAARIIETGNKLTTVKGCSLLIEGQIAAGDAERVQTILERDLRLLSTRKTSKKQFDAEYDKHFVACLVGPGGSYLEGIRMGELFAKMGVVTLVPDNGVCESACAVAFLGGQVCCDEKGKPVAQRFLYPGSRLGFHAPSLNLAGSNQYTRENALLAYDLGLEAVSRLRRNAELFFINDLFMSRIFAHRGQDYFFIKTLDEAEINNIQLTGYRPRRLKRDTNQAACWNAFNWHVHGWGYLSESGNRDEFWKSVFQDYPTEFNYFVRGSDIYVFYPFDGDAKCLVREVKRNGRRMLHVTISELDVYTDKDPRLKGLFRPTLLMRGNRTLESTR